MSKIEGKNILLRPIKEKDLEYLNRWKNNEHIFKNLGGGYHPISIDQQKEWLKSLIDLTGKNRRFIIADKNNKPLGMIGLYSINNIHRNAEVGLYVGNIEKQSKGIGSEAYLLLENYAKNYLNLRKLKLSVVKSNHSAYNFWEKNKFIKVGCWSRDRYINGEYLDVILMEKFLQDGK